MASYASLTAAQKTTVQHAVNAMLRGSLGEFQRVLNHLQTSLNEYNGNGVGTILSGVTATDVVSNDSNLAGSGDLLVSDITGMVASITSFLGTYNAPANQQTYAKWAGGPNVLG